MLWSFDCNTNSFELTGMASSTGTCPIAATGLMREARTCASGKLSRTSLSFVLLRGVSNVFPRAPRSFRTLLRYRMRHGEEKK